MPEMQRARERRILVLAPLGRDATLTTEVLRGEGFVAVPCRGMEELCARIRRGAGAALLTEESLLGDERELLPPVLDGQPPWSDFPLILVCSGGAESGPARWALERLTNVLVLEKPVRVATLVGALQNALRARARQYQIRAHLQERERTAAQLLRSNAELERFAYVASHDLQEPLRAVLSYTQLLDSRFRQKMGPDADEFLGFIVSGARRMHRLINDLLAFSRVDAAPRTVSQVDTARIVSQVLRDLHPNVEEARAVVEVGPLPVLAGNETQLAQLFMNLIGNAIKFRGDRDPRVEVSAEREAQAWVFSVRDNGIGIESCFNERIFEVFRRLHDQNRYPGTGIGLAVCKKIVERYDGRIWVESEPGQGSVFRFRLPDAPSQVLRPEHAAAPRGRRRVQVAPAPEP